MQVSSWEVQINYVYIEANHVANAFANLGVELSCDFTLF